MGIITDILKEIPLSAVLRERLTIQERRMSDLETEVTTLKAQLEACQKDNEELRRKIREYEQVSKELPKGPRTKRGDFM